MSFEEQFPSIIKRGYAEHMYLWKEGIEEFEMYSINGSMKK